MKIKYEILKQNEKLSIFKNIDDFYKMYFENIIDETFNDIDDLFDLQLQINLLKTSYKILKNELKKYNINDYILLCDYIYENIYIYDKNINEIFYIDDDCVFCENYEMYKIDNDYNKIKIMRIFLNELF